MFKFTKTFDIYDLFLSSQETLREGYYYTYLTTEEIEAQGNVLFAQDDLVGS